MKSIIVFLITTMAWTAAAQTRNMVCLFNQPNFQGAKFCFTPGQRPPDLDAFPLSDGTFTNGIFGSILVEGSAVGTIYDSKNYRSRSVAPMQVTTSIPNLADVWTSTIFSLVVR